MPTQARPLLTETTFHVRFAETDQMRVVHHAAYLVYFEEGRSELCRQHGVPYVELENSGLSLALSEVSVRYLAPARYDERITVRAWVEQLRSRGITFAYEIVNAASQQTLVTGQTRHICIDQAGQVRRIPEGWSAPLKAAAEQP
jgi:acyl-CoA thioester hydrolase